MAVGRTLLERAFHEMSCGLHDRDVPDCTMDADALLDTEAGKAMADVVDAAVDVIGAPDQGHALYVAIQVARDRAR